MNADIEEVLREILKTYGTDVLTNGQRFDALLADLAHGQEKERFLLTASLEFGTPHMVLRIGEVGHDLSDVRLRLAGQLSVGRGIAEESATWVVDCWARSLGVRGWPAAEKAAAEKAAAEKAAAEKAAAEKAAAKKAAAKKAAAKRKAARKQAAPAAAKKTPQDYVSAWGAAGVAMNIRGPAGSLCSIVAVSNDGHLGQFYHPGPNRLVVDFPALLAAHRQPYLSDVRFSGPVALSMRDAGRNLKTIVAVTTDGRLAQIWDDQKLGWQVDFPVERTGSRSVRFSGPVALSMRDAGRNLKTIVAVTTDGRLAQIWDDQQLGWQVDFPVERTGSRSVRFSGPVALSMRDAGRNLKTIVAVTTDGRLAQIWDDQQLGWQVDFPVERTGSRSVRFSGPVALSMRDAGRNLKTIVAVTTDGRLAQIWDESSDWVRGLMGRRRLIAGRWLIDYPSDLVRYRTGAGVSFGGGVAMEMRSSAQNLKTIVAVTQEGRLAQLWDEPPGSPHGSGWNMDFPGQGISLGESLAHWTVQTFVGSVAMKLRDPEANLKTIVASAPDGHLVMLWDAPNGVGWKRANLVPWPS